MKCGPSRAAGPSGVAAGTTAIVSRSCCPAKLRAVPLQPDHPYPAALALGPVVLALRATTMLPRAAFDLEHLDELLEAFPWRKSSPTTCAPILPSSSARSTTSARASRISATRSRARRSHSARASELHRSLAERRSVSTTRMQVGATAECTFTGTGIPLARVRLRRRRLRTRHDRRRGDRDRRSIRPGPRAAFRLAPRRALTGRASDPTRARLARSVLPRRVAISMSRASRSFAAESPRALRLALAVGRSGSRDALPPRP